MARRSRQYMSLMGSLFSDDGGDAQSSGRFRKRHPLDCGRSRCKLCHSEKIFKRRNPAQIRADEKFAYELKEVG